MADHPENGAATDEDALIAQRCETMAAGVMEAVRREVAYLRARNLPVWVADNGTVIDANAKPTSPQDDP